ncbi:multidrug ABC transporter ATPase/permease [Mycobacterium tuberculosis variant bovis BCG]|nr:multidrug ABC transporter ATPase/permease [Mycobacterium tuberculosis variant bovis BCG]
MLREISLSVRAGETLAVVGAPGSGKSTLASLATRCYDVTQGAVRIGGQDVRELTLDSLRSAIGLVPEDAVLFSGTIGANIAYGRPDATPEQIATAARAAHIEEFVNTLPDGYQTAVGARGLTLSGGQRQRIALARALLHQPRLLIMDDPTSAVDAVIECGIQEVLREAIADRTAVIFTRRRSMLTLADRVAVLDSGRLLDVGTPTRCGSAVPAIGNCCRPRRISPMTWLSRSARRCVDRWPGSAPRPRSTPTSTTRASRSPTRPRPVTPSAA